MTDYAKDLKDAINLIGSITDYETPIMDRRLPRGKSHTAGKQTRLPMCVWFYSIFQLNEIYACKGQLEMVLHEQQIKMNWEREYGNRKPRAGSRMTPGGSITSGKHSIGLYRNKYREGRLFKGQLKPIMLSFRYSGNKLVCIDRQNRKFYNHNECRELSLKYKIADPRFFTKEEIAEIKQHAMQSGEILSWGIPSKSQWSELDAISPGGIFRCIRTKTPWTDT